ncbi:MAG: HAMP domain-containing histidine kinase [Firmicutes bacterium]|nr:HAMP domain-containing histidine kinase [Bacillota bacterium]
MVWFFSTNPWISTIWILLNLFLLIYLFPKILKLPKITIEANSLIAPNKSDKINLLSKIFQQLDQYILIIQSDGVISEFTQPWMELFSIEENASITMKALRLAPKLWSTINQGLATEKGAQFQWELSNQTFQSSLTPLFLDQTFYGVMVTAIDITKISQLEQIQSDFLADISHEIKTPLAAILGASEILNQSTRKLTTEETKEFQTMIASESSRLQRLIHELTDLSKIGTHGFQTLIKTKFSILDLLTEVKQVYQLELDKKALQFKIKIPKELNIFVDRDKFFLIFSNLLSNAIRYTDKGAIQVSSEIKNQTLILYFADTGRGIEPKNLARIFDRFYRTDAARTRVSGGSGLGLAITRGIVQAHQGTIEVSSQLGKGTTFTLTIPHLT